VEGLRRRFQRSFVTDPTLPRSRLGAEVASSAAAASLTPTASPTSQLRYSSDSIMASAAKPAKAPASPAPQLKDQGESEVRACSKAESDNEAL
jgi:hypothetical protein